MADDDEDYLAGNPLASSEESDDDESYDSQEEPIGDEWENSEIRLNPFGRRSAASYGKQIAKLENKRGKLEKKIVAIDKRITNLRKKQEKAEKRAAKKREKVLGNALEDDDDRKEVMEEASKETDRGVQRRKARPL